MNKPDNGTLPMQDSTNQHFMPDNTASIIFDSNNVVLSINKQAQQWLGDITPRQTQLNDAWLTGQGMHMSDRHFRTLSIESLILNQHLDRYVGLTLPKETLWLQWQMIPTRWNDKDAHALMLTDVSDLMLDLHSLQQQAEDADTRDFATHLYNRRYAMERLEQMHHHAKRYHSPFAIAMIDIDHFKRINDTFGHGYGDEVLERLASVLRKSFRETDLCCRFGGEEFLVLMPETETAEAIFSLDRLRQQVSEMKWAQMQRPVTISSGVISWQPNKSVEQLIFLADQRLTTAKKAGRNQVCGDLL